MEPKARSGREAENPPRLKRTWAEGSPTGKKRAWKTRQKGALIEPRVAARELQKVWKGNLHLSV